MKAKENKTGRELELTRNEGIDRIEYLDQSGMTRAYVLLKREDKTLIIVKTVVDQDLAGQGIGKLLMRDALEKAKAEELTLSATCSYAMVYFEKHPDPIYQKRN